MLELLPPLCVASTWAVALHLAYLLHVAACEWYGDRVKNVLAYFAIRHDFTAVHSLLLEWVHTGEMAAMLALAAFGCERRESPVAALCMLVAAVAFLGCCRVVCSNRPSRVFGRRGRAATLCAMALCLAPPLLGARVAWVALLTVHAHAVVVPSATLPRALALPGARGGGLLWLLAAHGSALGLGYVALAGRSGDDPRLPGAAAASALLVGVGREVALAVDRRWPRLDTPPLRGPGANHSVAHLLPLTPLDRLLPRWDAAGKPAGHPDGRADPGAEPREHCPERLAEPDDARDEGRAKHPHVHRSQAGF